MKKKVALGFTGTVDYELEWQSVNLNGLIKELDIGKQDIRYYDTVASLKDLISFILYFMFRGEGCGLFTDRPAPLFNLIDKCSYKITLGGTAIRAACVLASSGVECNVSLSSQNKIIRENLFPLCNTFCGMEEDYFAPHVVLQYPAQCEIRGSDFSFMTQKDNRLIFTCDTSNSNLHIRQDFLDQLKDCSVFLISSLELVEDTSLLKSLVNQIDEALHLYTGHIFYEDACFKKREHAEMINRMLAQHKHIHSMNEDEFSSYLGRRPDFLDGASMKEAMKEVRNITGADKLLLHTAKYSLMYGEGCENFQKALKTGVLYSSVRYAFGDLSSAELIKQIEDNVALDAEGENLKKQIHEIDQFICIPSFDIRTENAVTIGLGDTFAGGFILGVLNTE